LRSRITGTKDHQAGAIRQRQDLAGHLLDRLGDDRAAALGAVGTADAGEEEAQVVVDLGDGADRRAGVATGALLVDRDGRREPLDVVDIGLLHLAEELAGVGGEALDVAALPFGEDGVEGEGALAGAGEPGQHDQLVAGDVDVDVLEVVLAGAADADRVVLGHPPFPLGRSPSRRVAGATRTTRTSDRKGRVYHGGGGRTPSGVLRERQPRRVGSNRLRP
jgi:hypothetical protein